MNSRITMQIIAHEDADGICSAALVRMNDPTSKIFFSKPCSLLHDLDQMDSRRDLIVLDIALCELAKEQIVSRLSRWRGKVLYIDHHPDTATSLSKHNRKSKVIAGTVSASELTFTHLAPRLKQRG